LLSRMCVVNKKDYSVIPSSFRGPSIICNHTAGNECTA
jgi:hypothetical protein